MRFEFLVALKYLIPRLRQLSVSIISLISVIVISLVVWLVIVFLSVTDGIEKKWVDELVSLNAPIRITPTEAYYDSYYYQIDQVSSASDFETKTLGEKLKSQQTDPYNQDVDSELPSYFPAPFTSSKGQLKDLVKELHEAIEESAPTALKTSEYEVAFGNLRLNLVRQSNDFALNGEKGPTTTFLSQVSYISSLDAANPKFQKIILKPRQQDLQELFQKLNLALNPTEDSESEVANVNDSELNTQLHTFLNHSTIESLITPTTGWEVPSLLLPREGNVKACGILSNGTIHQVVIPENLLQLYSLQKQLTQSRLTAVTGTVYFNDNSFNFLPDQGSENTNEERIAIYLAPGITLATQGYDPENHEFEVQALIQSLKFSGTISPKQLRLGKVSPQTEFSHNPDKPPFWVYKSSENHIPSHDSFGDGILLSKSFQNNGVFIGDRGYLSFFTPNGSSMQEQRLPIYVAGFYDQGLMPIGSKLVFADANTVAALRGNVSIADKALGNGFYVRFDKLDQADQIKSNIIANLEKHGIAKYWQVESYTDFEFSKPLLEQLKSDKTLFTLIAIIILIVACSNIISMLILLVNDKKREIGIMQSMGASSFSIALIFGLCGFFTGLLSCLIGTTCAILTLANLQYLVDFLSFIQGHDAFQAAFYGSTLPSDLSYSSLTFVVGATIIISLLAGIVPAIKASMLKPSEILRGQ